MFHANNAGGKSGNVLPPSSVARSPDARALMLSHII
jgi:hypothetical protein